MPLPVIVPLDPSRDWSEHKQSIKVSKGAICYGAISAHFGTDSPSELEFRIDNRRPYHLKDGDTSVSNKYRRWRNGQALPSKESRKWILKKSGGSVRLAYWQDHFLWDLLAPKPPSVELLNRFLESASASIRKLLFLEKAPNQYGRFIHKIPNRQEILGIRNLHSLEAFVMLLCLARKGDLIEYDPLHKLAAASAYDIFPRILYSHKPLAYKWERLFGCIHSVFWQNIYGEGLVFPKEIDTVRNNLEELYRNPNAKWKMTSGTR